MRRCGVVVRHAVPLLVAVALGCGSTHPDPVAVAPDASPTGPDASAEAAATRPPFDVALCERLRDLARAYVAAKHTPGIVFHVERPDRSICAGAAGLADIAAGVAMSEASRFRISS